jgi:hypothetical protein
MCLRGEGEVKAAYDAEEVQAPVRDAIELFLAFLGERLAP